jgi:DnaJ-class molecular chaperone
MEQIKVACKKCGGFGYTRQAFVAGDDGLTLKMERDICEECNGTGYTEYAMFTIEEAKAILKHCGLTTES